MNARLASTLMLVGLAACGREAAPPSGKTPEAPSAAPKAVAAAEAPPQASTREDGGEAAEALRRYYALLEAGDYAGAWRMRSGRSEGAERLAENFRAYRTYRANVGTPSLPVEADGWLYVEVPVMITGTFKGGKPFGSSGSVTLRRADSAANAAPAERNWRIHAGG